MAKERKKAIRAAFRGAVFSRDGYKCVFCDCTRDLDAHHITDRNLMPNGGYVKENGITLCPDHHFQAESYDLTQDSDFQPDRLYQLIGSSHAAALQASDSVKAL